MDMRIIVLALFAPLLTQGADTKHSDASETQSFDLELFNLPKPITLKPPTYPRGMLHQGKEGWVNLNFMIDTQGIPYEIAVTDSTGEREFEKSAIKTVESWLFEPASLDGQPIESGQNYKVIFAIDGGTGGARPRFVRQYRKLIKTIKTGDKDVASQILAKMEVANLYEDAYFHLGRSYYYNVWGNQVQRYAALKKAIAHEKDNKFLPEDVFIATLFRMYMFEIKSQNFGKALNSARTLAKQKLDEKKSKVIQQSIKDILALQKDDGLFVTTGEINHKYSWFTPLLKQNFEIEISEGELAEIKLRCQGKYIFFRYHAEKSYRIPGSYGKCNMELLGNPGTTFKLAQY